MGLCIGASLMSFVELIDLALNCLFIYCASKGKRVEMSEEEVAEKSESEVRFIKLESQLNVCIEKIACLEAELSATRDKYLNY